MFLGSAVFTFFNAYKIVLVPKWSDLIYYRKGGNRFQKGKKIILNFSEESGLFLLVKSLLTLKFFYFFIYSFYTYFIYSSGEK